MKKYLIIFILLLGSLASSGQQQYRVELIKIQNEEKLLNAHVLMLQNKFLAAIEILEKLLLENPKEGAFAYELSKVYWEGEDNLTEATKFIEKAIDLDPENTWYLAHAAFLYSSIGAFNKELSINQRLISLEPHYIEHYMRTSKNYVLNNDYSNAIKTITNYELRNGTSEWTVLEKHQLYDLAGNHKKAISILEDWIINHPHNIKYLLILAEYQDQRGMKNFAKDNYKKVLDIDKNHRIANRYLFNHGMNSNNGTTIDLHWFSNPDIDINTKIGKLLSEIKNLKTPEQIDQKQLITFAQAVSDAHPKEAKSYAVLADLHSLRGNLKEALVNYQKAIALDQNHYLVWESVLSLLNETGNDKLLLELSEKFLLLFPEKYQSYWYSGLANYKNKKYKDAIEILEESQLISSSNEEIWSKVTGLLAINISLNKNDLDLGIEIIDKGLLKFPDNSELEQCRLYLKARFGKNLEIPMTESRQSSTLALAQVYHLFNMKEDQKILELNAEHKRLGTSYNEFLTILLKSHDRQNKIIEKNEVSALLRERGAFSD